MIYYVVIPTLLTFAPWLVVRYMLATKESRSVTYRQAIPYLWTAAVLWVVALSLPVVPINNQTESFGIHFTGGIVACILFYFAAKAYGWRFSIWWYAPVVLYFFASGLGVANELFELFLNQTGIVVADVHQNDTWWDLTANTLGAATAFLCSKSVRYLTETRQTKTVK